MFVPVFRKIVAIPSKEGDIFWWWYSFVFQKSDGFYFLGNLVLWPFLSFVLAVFVQKRFPTQNSKAEDKSTPKKHLQSDEF